MGYEDWMGMSTPTLAGALDSLGRVGQRLGEDWAGISQAIQGGQAGIGAGDVLAGAFRETYEDPARIVRTSAGQTPGLYEELAGAGVAGMNIYIGGETIAADGFPN
ncbi:hypothetical protein [Actinoplanes sp. NPDC049265]|uniref:hypothetical protein n=1 Tax=Actinoplanes sp. NPDC049265 TaxID=3363902 RepID=UPI00371907D3